MALQRNGSQDGVVGILGTVTDTNGNASAKALIPAVVLVDETGGATNSATAIGATDDAAWNGTDPEATVIALLKAIALNTTPP